MKSKRRIDTGHPGNDFTGQRFGNLLVVERTEERTYNQIVFRCVCDCGTEIKATSSHLDRKNNPITHCGCMGVGKTKRSVPGYLGHKGALGKTMENKKTGPREDAAFRSLYSYYKQSARRRNLAFNLDMKFFLEVTKKPCVYCGIEPNQAHTVGELTYTYNGIDRLDSAEGYTPKNALPCCGTCNIAKGTLSYIEFKDWVCRVYSHMIKSEESTNMPIFVNL